MVPCRRTFLRGKPKPECRGVLPRRLAKIFQIEEIYVPQAQSQVASRLLGNDITDEEREFLETGFFVLEFERAQARRGKTSLLGEIARRIALQKVVIRFNGAVVCTGEAKGFGSFEKCIVDDGARRIAVDDGIISGYRL